MPCFPAIYSEEFLDHDTGAFHPECAGRLRAIVDRLKAMPWADAIEWVAPTPAGDREILRDLYRVHHPDYVAAVRQLAERGGGFLDGDTVVSPRSYEVALLAVSAWLDGVDRVLATAQPAFALARPPGHHARPRTGMGFCLFNNAAIAALYALEREEVRRVAILDWDVHHGNGTQEAIWNRPDIAYISTHQAPFYPGTGRTEERGAHGNVLNFPLPAGSTIADLQPLFASQIVPFLQGFQPDLLIVSAGFDANADDPLAEILLQPQDYGTLTDLCLEVTRKILFGLEGGYDFNSLSCSVAIAIERCLVGQA